MVQSIKAETNSNHSQHPASKGWRIQSFRTFRQACKNAKQMRAKTATRPSNNVEKIPSTGGSKDMFTCIAYSICPCLGMKADSPRLSSKGFFLFPAQIFSLALHIWPSLGMKEPVTLHPQTRTNKQCKNINPISLPKIPNL